MSDCLNQKRQEVVTSLITNLSGRNRDFETCLNAHTILFDMTEQAVTFTKLIQREVVVKLIEAACDIMNPNQAYALDVLAKVIREYPDFERSLQQAQQTEFQQTIGMYFHDLTYSSLMVIKASDSALGAEGNDTNQAGATYKRFGMRRMRALELIRHELHSISRYPELNAIQQISIVLRRHLIQTMLSIVSEYSFCSAACHEAIEVLDILKIAFDDEDIEELKSFVIANLSFKRKTHYTFPETGTKATNSNHATIVKIAIALKRLLTSGTTAVRGRSGSIDSVDAPDQDNESHGSGDEKGAVASLPAKSYEHLNDQRWKDFCDKKLKRFESKWTKRLETYTEEDHAQMRYEDQEADVDDIVVTVETTADESGLISLNHEEEEEVSKEFLASSFWKVEDAYKLDDLLADFEQ